jgi:NAD(P)H-hydrate epimerase
MSDPVRTLFYEALLRLLTPRDPDSHKGSFGHVLVVGGDHGTGGAALMTAEAAARTGAGLTSVATRPEHVAAFLPRRPELMVHGIEQPGQLELVADRATVLIVGPGLGRSAWSADLLRECLRLAAARDLPMVLDADALNLLSAETSLAIHGTYGKWILTPHAGEAARLLGISRAEVDNDRVAAVQQLQDKYGGVAILKGAGTLLCYLMGRRRHLARCMHGNPGMASGGMGDVLSGVLGGLLAQHFTLADSARLGVCIHSKAADLAAAEHGERGLLATDLLPYVRRLLNP